MIRRPPPGSPHLRSAPLLPPFMPRTLTAPTWRANYIAAFATWLRGVR